MTVHNLHAEAHRHSALRDELKRRFPDMESDEQLLADSLEGFSNLTEEVAAVLSSIDDDEMLIVGIKKRIEELALRGQRLEARAQSKRDAILYCLIDAGETRMELPACTLSVRHNPAKVMVIDETKVPELYLVYPDAPPPKLDKRTILVALKDGTDVPGCELGNGGSSLVVRTK